ncbi:MAG TPA: lamin tail domain-containing protein, partial [Myxococcota bacterium]|nr:lamin tail domain-containing protein [Myxococcota bacterium]
MKRWIGLLGTATVLVPCAAAAHTIAVDGVATDWTMAAPTNLNTGHIGRDALFQGEYVWNDPTGDERTFFATPDGRCDIDTFAVTADATNLYVMVKMANIDLTAGDGAPQVQIAVDLDGLGGSGNLFFRGFADTNVAGPAAWEYLIQTRFASGSLPAVWNVAGTNVAAGTAGAIDATTEVIEILIPWTSLGFAPGAGPTAPMRFTVATFRSNPADDTFDDGAGSGVSNAVDVLSSYGNPVAPAAVQPNTSVETMDQVVDYRFELWFNLDAQREPSAPIVISEVLYDAGALLGVTGEGVEIFNVTGVDLSLSGWRLGDEETVDAGEAMLFFPSRTIRAGHVATVANSTTVYAAAFGRNPDFEVTTANAFVPNMTSDATWASGGTAGFNLSDTGDNVLLLDPYYTVVDVAQFETPPAGSAYPGVTSHPGVAASQSIARTPVRRDTNNCAVDFAVQAIPTGGVPASPCTDETALGLVVNGTACDDGLPCNETETCTAGVCSGGAPVTCPADGNPCTQDVCTTAFNGCYPPQPTGTACDDGLVCTLSTTCSATAACTGGSPVICPAPGDACDLAACSPATGCSAAAGTACSDLNACTMMDTCDAAGTCLAGGPVGCNDGNGCTDDSCAPATGCVFTPNTAACDDGSMCTMGDVCGGGICSGAAVTCVDGNVCTD